MKQCPKCRTTYTDQSLRFCLADGAPLDDVPESVATVYPGKTEPIRIDLPPTQAARISPVTTDVKRASGTWIKIVVGVLLLGLLGFGVLLVAGALIYFNSASHAKVSAEKSPTLPDATSPTPDKEKEKLQDELANLLRKLEEQKSSDFNSNTGHLPSGTETQTGLTRATVNSPNDGFLALRSLPDANYGDRVAKIPHGAAVDVISCTDDRVTIGGRSGRWCLVTYK